ncbi:MAG: glutaredoxin family protein [Prochlorococcaceae cyanobacterium]
MRGPRRLAGFTELLGAGLSRLLALLVPALLALGLLLGPGSALAGGEGLPPAHGQPGEPVLEVYVRPGCPHCAAAKRFLPELQRLRPALQLRIRSLDTDPTAAADLQRLSRQAGIAAPGVPSFVIDGELLVGFDNAEGRGRDLLALVDRRGAGSGGARGVRAGPFGSLTPERLGLHLFTLLLGLLDGFNPCAMWVLLFLLSLLVHWRDRRRMALVAGTFVLVSGAVYYAFLAAWLNLFLVVGFSAQLRIALALLALVVGVLNLREYGRSRERFVLSIPERAKPGLYGRMRGVIQTRALLPALAGVVSLAVVVNLVELLCTAGLPALALVLLLRPGWLL